MISFGTAKAWLRRQLLILSGVLLQAVIPGAVSLLWAILKTAETSLWSWTTFIGSFMSSLAVMSILASQWFRVAKQFRDQENHGNLRQDVAGLTELAQRIHAAQTGAGLVPVGGLEAGGPGIGQQDIQLAQSPDEYFAQARELLRIGQGLPAMWMAAMGFERAVRDAAAASSSASNPSLMQTVRSLAGHIGSAKIVEELLLLTRLRNQLAHPIDKSTTPVHDASILDPERIVRSFEIGASQVQDGVGSYQSVSPTM